MMVYRLARSPYARDLSGKGAAKTGGRWNSKGVEMIYTSESRSLCTVEIAVHTPLGLLPVDFILITLEIPDDIEVEEILPVNLPFNWNVFPHIHATQSMGDAFVRRQKSLILRVPSAVVSGDYNLLINPHHREIRRVKVLHAEPFIFDKRLFE